ncbi:hypothetical protein CAAN1_03S05468 [[Candida] anglica]|uniref:Mitochondrial 15S rRNA processing factor CCM1 n=1 Tax=[Candida] anglica TaxID=148631 RepID=A0ABP0EHJ2_9ASCO
MIPLRQAVGRSLLRNGIARSSVTSTQVALLNRFQSTSTNPVEVTKSSRPDGESKPREQHSRGGRRGGDHKAGNRPSANFPKVRDIANQIRGVTVKAGDDLQESFQILEEGLAYLRQIQTAEGIPEPVLYTAFQEILQSLMEKASKPGVKTGGRSMEDILNLYISFNVAHGYHFCQVMASELINSEAPLQGYEAVLNWWVKYVEYKRAQPLCESTHLRAHNNGPNKFYRNDVVHLSFYAFLQSILEQGIEFDPKVAYKIFATEDLPQVYNVGQTVVRFKVKPSMEEYHRTFGKAIDVINIETLDPNGPLAINRIVQAVQKNSVSKLNYTYRDILSASKSNGKPVMESTLVRIMSAYAALQAFDKTLEVFQDLLNRGISKPSTAAWENMLLACCHPNYLSEQPKDRRDQNVNRVEQFVSTMEMNGTKITPKTLAIIIGCFANLNRFDKVDQYLQKFTVDSDKPLPIVHLTRNNILNGLILFGNVSEAEKKMKLFQEEDPTYFPGVTVMNSYLSYYVKAKNFNAVDGILTYMKDNHVAYDLATYTILIDMHFKLTHEKGQEASLETVLDLFKDANANNLKINEVAISTLIYGLCKDGVNTEAARVLFKYAKKSMRLTPQLVTTMMTTELEFGSIEESQKLFELYIKDFSNSTRVWNQMIKGLLNKNDDLAFEYFNRLKKEPKADPNFFTYYFLLNHFNGKDKRDKVQELIDDLNAGALKNLGEQIPRVLKRLEGKYNISAKLLPTK